MRLSEYLDKYAWSQAELARRAGISTQSVARALSGQAISRRNAEAIVAVINQHEKVLGSKTAVTLADVRGLHITKLQRKKPRGKGGKAEPEQGGETENP